MGYSPIYHYVCPSGVSLGQEKAEFRGLSFREQLEVVSRKLFCQDAKAEKTDSILTFTLDYPPLPAVQVADLPVSFLTDYWAGYSCQFNPKWYVQEYRGLTPLDDYGVEYDRMVNIWLFTFPFLSIDASLFYVASWFLREFPDNDLQGLLLSSCKVYLYLEMLLQEDAMQFGEHTNKDDLVQAALCYFQGIYSFFQINHYCPIIEDCNHLFWFEEEELALYPLVRRKGSRYYYPLIPSGLFRAPGFRMTTWQFLK